MNLNLFGEEFNSEIWRKEWQSMPEFTQEDTQPFKQMIVNFETEQDYRDFSKFMGQSMTFKTKSIWFPKYDREKPSNFLYINES
jgi:hypothetical protein